MFVSAILFVLLLAVLYVLSTGPAMVLLQTGRIDEATYATIYYPLLWVCLENDALLRVWNAYDNFWLTLFGYPEAF